MDIQLANDIIAMMPDERTVFRYYPDRYAIMLLEYAMTEGVSISQLKSSRFAKLLNRPAIKNVVAQCGNGYLTPAELALAWPVQTQNYVLTLGLWGQRKPGHRGWYQTSRAGTNLVLQLNFDRGHDGAYKKLAQQYGDTKFFYDGHPINKKGRNTLSWARIDLDLDSGEALIEELQNDWLRNAYDELSYVQKSKKINPAIKTKLKRYVNDNLEPHAKTWSEAMLSATLFFLVKEIGIKKIWIHDFETGNRLKQIKWSKPPRSLYTSLPKKFCFEKVKQAPSFLHQSFNRKLRKRIDNGEEAFWQLVV